MPTVKTTLQLLTLMFASRVAGDGIVGEQGFYFLTLRLTAPMATATARQHRQLQGDTNSGDKDISDGSKAASMTTATGRWRWNDEGVGLGSRTTGWRRGPGQRRRDGAPTAMGRFEARFGGRVHRLAVTGPRFGVQVRVRAYLSPEPGLNQTGPQTGSRFGLRA
ncbi:hypothetical protein EDB89DRAFT_1903553 [Lactarius sanguifluus]|nr:hypothetical protein EDB89DRAFT_1903553 [Lactarius sanguifluus]